jgi:hypothetical protein
VVVTSGGASGHISVSAFDLGDLRIGRVRWTAAAAATETAIAGLPARLLPKGGCASPASNDTVASPVFDRHAVSKVLAALAH